MANDNRALFAKVIQHSQHIETESIEAVGLAGQRTAAAPIATHIQCHGTIAGIGNDGQLMAPAVPQTGITVAHDDERACTLANQAQPYLAGIQVMRLHR